MQSRCNSSQFVHLHLHSEFSFLDGASHLEALVRCVAMAGQPAIAITDHDNLCAAPTLQCLCNSFGLKPIYGTEFTLDTGHVIALAKNRNGFSTLCRLLTRAHLDNERGTPILPEQLLIEGGNDLIILSGCAQSPLATYLRSRQFDRALAWATTFKNRFGADFYIEVERTCEPHQTDLNARLVQLARELRITIVATNNVHYASRSQAQAQDLLTCIRHLIKVDEPHAERKLNAELFFCTSDQMQEKFSDLPEAIESTVHIADKCDHFAIFEQRFAPRFNLNGKASEHVLRELTYAGAARCYGNISPLLEERINYELRTICDLRLADYFLVVQDLVQFTRSKRIRHAGRGSAADSVVAFCLDITKVDSFARNLRFERFINPERANNLPDIDIDFDARYRDDVTEYVTKKHGQDHVATVCTFARFRARSAIRDVGKALGFSVSDIDELAKSTHWATSAAGLRRAVERRPELRALHISARKFDLLFDLCRDIDNLPRNISTHLGGVVITGDPIWEISPLQMAAKGVQVIQYDKDGVEDLRLHKLDLLSLRMLGAVEDTVVNISKQDPLFEYDRIPSDDEATFEMIRNGDTAGAFQIESPAQMSLHPRLKTSTYADIVASVALIRPGPVKGEMVEPFIRRRNGLEAPTVLHPAIEKILSSTYGVVLYQEQVISIAIELAKFTPGHADTLRRTISHSRSYERMDEIGKTFVKQAMDNGVDSETASRVFAWLIGYAGYGFCEAHAAAFGDTSYKSAYLLKHYPAEFYAAILNNEPMGFYPSATIVNEARIRGVEILYPCLQASAKECTVENGKLRVGLKMIRGITESDVNVIISSRPYSTWSSFFQRTGISRDIQENLILSGAAQAFGENRRALLFNLGVSLQENMLALDTEMSARSETKDFTAFDRFKYEWDILGFSPAKHPMQFWRRQLTKIGVKTNEQVKAITDSKSLLTAAGWAIRPHTPPTKSGKTVVFFTLEDETGLLNVTAFPDAYEKYGHQIFRGTLLQVTGRKDHRGANSLIVESIAKLS